MMVDEINFVEQLSYNVAVKKRFFIAFEFTPKSFDRTYTFDDALAYLNNEEYRQEDIWHNAVWKFWRCLMMLFSQIYSL